jgi:hypothetical protein
MADKSDVPSTKHLRLCAGCGQQYSIEELRSSSPHYFEAPHNYDSGCEIYCLSCWLGGPWKSERDG